MLDTITLDQLRLFVAAAEEGSFSAAGRKLYKVPSAVSYGISNLEDNLGVELFDRSKRSPTLNDSGKALFIKAKGILLQVDQLYNQAQSIKMGMESRLSVAVDIFFPRKHLIQICKNFRLTFPTIPLEIYLDAFDSVLDTLIKKRCHIGIVGTLSQKTAEIKTYTLGNILMITVVSIDHPLAFINREKPGDTELSDYVQIELIDRTNQSVEKQEIGLVQNKWFVDDLETQKSLIVGGLGWGIMPVHTITDEIRNGQLIRLDPQIWRNNTWKIPLYCVHRIETQLGTAAHWFYKNAEKLLRK